MKIAEDLTILEILGIAVQTEHDQADFYRKFAAGVKNPMVTRKLESLASEEDSHARTLTEEYKRISSGEELLLPQGFTTGIKKEIDPSMTPERIIETAMGYEKAAQEFYQEAARRAEDPKGRQVLEYLSEFEADHYRFLETELRQLRRNPDWFEQEHELMHVGP